VLPVRPCVWLLQVDGRCLGVGGAVNRAPVLLWLPHPHFYGIVKSESSQSRQVALAQFSVLTWGQIEPQVSQIPGWPVRTAWYDGHVVLVSPCACDASHAAH